MLKREKHQDMYKMLVNQLHKDLIKSKKELLHNKFLTEYDKKNTMFFILNVAKDGEIAKPSSSKNSEVTNIEILCNKIKFYNQQYEIYSNLYNQFKLIKDISVKPYNTSLNKLVKHLRVKTATLINYLKETKF